MAKTRNLHDDNRLFKRLYDEKDRRITSSTRKTGLYKVKCRYEGCPEYVDNTKLFCNKHIKYR